MSRSNLKQTGGAAVQFVADVERAAAEGSSLGDSFTEKGTAHLLAALRAGAPYARLIAFAGDKFNIGDQLVAKASSEMEAAAARSTDDDDQDESSVDPEPYYLLGILVGLELANGFRAGVR